MGMFIYINIFWYEFYKILQYIHVFSFLSEFLHNTVKHIEMSRTFIHSIDDETFQGLRLESLKLVDNKILEFSEKSFK